MPLIIVESPTKARTFNRILKGGDYFVFATMGHIRDLPSSSMSIDTTHDFKPNYEIIKTKQKVVSQLKELAKEHGEIILATDPDREGESISYHAAYVLGLVKEKWPDIALKDDTIKRIVFHEITQHALQEALDHPETLRIDLVKAQQARRMLDRIVGYELSPLLWKKMGKNWLSAGRVQSVALRIIVEREKEIRAFKTEPYFQIYGFFTSGAEFKAKLIKKDDIPYEVSQKINLFAGTFTSTKTTISKDTVEGIIKDLETDSYTIAEIKEDIVKRYPPPPFTTSLLQQEGYQHFNFSSKMTMKLAQDLYERGMITYHRTDSFNLSTQFVFKAMDYIKQTYGEQYALEKPRGFKTKSKNAQEAHEAIRPTRLDRNPSDLEIDKKITHNHKKIYELIFNRAVATQMKEAEVKQIKLYIKSGKQYLFESEHSQVMFDGFLKVLNPDYAAKNSAPMTIKPNDAIALQKLETQESMTKPPNRYNEATLIKILEEKGIGRPSTYAPIISLIQEKYYIDKQDRYFVPTKLGESISEYLSEKFPKLFDLNFTASMEENLDDVADGKYQFMDLLKNFYTPFHTDIEEQRKDKAVIDVEEEAAEPCPKCGTGKLTVRFSKFGKFYACNNYPNCKFTKPFLHYVKDRLCLLDGGRLVTKFSKSKRKFYGCENFPTCTYAAWTLPPLPGTPAAAAAKEAYLKAVAARKEGIANGTIKVRSTSSTATAKKAVKKAAKKKTPAKKRAKKVVKEL